jgi:hypothetical protein
MRIRFLHTTASSNPHYPFQAGQIIEVPELTREMRNWLKSGGAEVLPEIEPEAAVVGADERAVEAKPRARGTR